MAGLPKKYFKMFPGNLKRAWAKYKADKGGGSSTPATTHKKKKKSGGHSGHHHKGGNMAKKKSAGGQFGGSPVKVLMFAGLAAGGGVATSYAVNKTPKVKDLSAGMKSGLQIAAGLAGMFFLKNKWLKGLSAGAVVAGTMGGVKAVLKVDPLAGPGGPKLPPGEMNRLTNGRMGVPANVRMGVPANVTMRGARSSGWGSQGWG